MNNFDTQGLCDKYHDETYGLIESGEGKNHFLLEDSENSSLQR